MILPAIFFRFSLLDKLRPHLLVAFEGFPVSDYKQEMPCTCDGNIHPAVVSEKSETRFHFLQFVRSHTVDDDNVFLSPLVSIHCVDLNE